MKPQTLAILFLVLLALPIVSASGGTGYYFVVQSDAPTTDVLTGVNFAASMKGSVAVTFSSALDKAPADAIVAVYVDGKSVRIVGDGEVAEAAKIYFTRQKFSVTSDAKEVIVKPSKDSSSDDEKKDMVPPQSPKEEEIDPIDAVDDSDKDSRADDDAIADSAVNAPPAYVPPAPVQEEERSFFGKIAAWFKGLFG